jgi:hypothetical protein
MAKFKDVPMGAGVAAGVRMPDEFVPKNSMVHVGGGVMDKGFDGHAQRNLDFESIIPRGVVAQTANGTSRDTGTGWNRDEPWSSPQLAPGGPWRKGRSNRTGE